MSGSARSRIKSHFRFRTGFPIWTGIRAGRVNVMMGQFDDQTNFGATLVNGFVPTTLDSNWAHGYESVLTPSAVRRDTFELRISRTSLKFGMPAYNIWWVDQKFPEIGWDKAVLQFGHHSYNPLKLCPPGMTCAPDTWHWDNVSISSPQPFTILKADVPYVDKTTRAWANFAKPAPGDSYLRFSAVGKSMEVSFDGGRTWQPAQRHQVERSAEETFSPYWMLVPGGYDARGFSWLRLVRGLVDSARHLDLESDGRC